MVHPSGGYWLVCAYRIQAVPRSLASIDAFDSSHAGACGWLDPCGEQKMIETVDYESYAFDLCSLLDEIEMQNADNELVDLLKHRFQIARDHGFTVTFEGSAEVGHA